MESCIEELGGLSDERVLVFISTSPTEANLLKSNMKRLLQRVDLKSYVNPAFTTEMELQRFWMMWYLMHLLKIFHDYRMSRHGMASCQYKQDIAYKWKYHWDYEGSLLTRYFGGTTPEYQTDIATLSSAITSVGLKLEYILLTIAICRLLKLPMN